MDVAASQEALDSSEGGNTMKARIFRMAVTASSLLILVESLGAGKKWG